MKLGKYSLGMGDRFGQQGVAQLNAILQAIALGLDITPVWNKSHRENTITGTLPDHLRREADAAVKALEWKRPYFVDADHVGLAAVDAFIPACDFFTLDVADYIGQRAAETDIDAFVQNHRQYTGRIVIPGIQEEMVVTEAALREITSKYLRAVQEAGRIYRRIQFSKGVGNFVVEVSMDETAEPQTPVEMFFILAAIAREGIPAQTIAPKFSGRFNKGVEYAGDIDQFSREFEEDLCVIKHAVNLFGLPKDLKLSVHSGSDKFSIYGPIHDALLKHGAGLHLKTAGTHWLEELMGLAEGGGAGLDIAKEIYGRAFNRFDELCAPYATVIDIDPAQLPAPATVAGWSSEDYVGALRHDQSCEQYNIHFRQFLHVSFRVAAEMGARYISAVKNCRDIIAANIYANIMQRHVVPLFAESGTAPASEKTAKKVANRA